MNIFGTVSRPAENDPCSGGRRPPNAIPAAVVDRRTRSPPKTISDHVYSYLVCDSFWHICNHPRARHLLRDTPLPIEDVSALCGFSSASYFIKVFRQRFHATPQAYRAYPNHP